MAFNIADIASRAAQEFTRRGAVVNTSQGYRRNPSYRNPAYGGSLGTPNIPSALTPDNLQTPATPLEVPPAPVSTAVPQAQGMFEVAAEQGVMDQAIQQQTDAEVALAKATESPEEAALRQTQADILAVQSDPERLREQEDLAKKQKVANQARKQAQQHNIQLLQEQRALQKQIEEIRKNTGGLIGGAVEAEVTKASRDSLSRQADISLNKMAALAELDSANFDLQTTESLIEAKKNLILEPLQQKLEFNKFWAERNFDKLDKAEQRQFDQLKTEDQRQWETQKMALDTAYDTYKTALSNGMPSATAQSALRAINSGNYEEAARLTAQYGAKPGTGGVGGVVSPLAQAVIENPELFNQLTPTDKAKIVPQLNAAGFTQFGKPLSDTAVKEISQTNTAILGLQDLRAKIEGNEQFIGPLSGLQRFNPYSKARQIQADVDRVRQVVGKALEGGVLRKEDEEKYKKILATLGDTPATALYKIDALIGDLTRNIATYEAGQRSAGRNVGSKPEDLRAKYSY